MGMTYSPKVEALRQRVADFMAANIYPNEAELFAAPVGRLIAGSLWRGWKRSKSRRGRWACGTCFCRTANSAPA